MQKPLAKGLFVQTGNSPVAAAMAALFFLAELAQCGDLRCHDGQF